MSNPFKVGDRVVRLSYGYGILSVGDIGEVSRVTAHYCWIQGDINGLMHSPSNLRAAIAGVDYPATKRDDNLPLSNASAYCEAAANSGHLSDGSSIQKHSAGGLYPVVIWHRDKKLPGVGKYDVGLTWPDQAEPVWFRDYDTAINVAEAIKESLK